MTVTMGSARNAAHCALLFCAITLSGPAWARSTAAAPDLRSSAFYIVDANDSTVLAARNAQKAAPIASITKLMTALVVLEAGQPMDEMITISKSDVEATLKGGSRLAQGTRLSRRDLMHLALMSSENRAAQALCRTYPGGEPACVRAAADNPVIREFSTDPEHVVYVRGQPMQFRSTNSLVKKPDWQVTVQKTGYIAEAGRCLVMQAIIDGRDVVIVLLNSWGRLTRIGDANRVRDWMETYHPDHDG